MKQRLLIIASVLSLSFVFQTKANGQWVQTNGPYGGYITSIIGNDSNIFIISSNGVYRLSGSDTIWTPINSGINNLNVNTLTLFGSLIFAGTNIGVYQSNDNGNNWFTVNTVLTDSMIRSFATMGNKIFACTSYGIFISKDTGKSWKSINMPPNASVGPLLTNGMSLIFWTENGEVFSTTNDGLDWSSLTGNVAPIYSLISQNGYVFAGTQNGVYESYGNSWVPVGLNSKFINTFVWDMIVNGNKLFAATNMGIFVTTNYGTNWDTLSTSGLSSTDIGKLAFIKNNLYTASGGFFVYSDSTPRWNPINTGLVSSSANLLVANKSNLFAYTNLGVFHSSNSGITWVDISSNLPKPDHPATSLAVKDTSVFVGLGDGNMYRSSYNKINWIQPSPNVVGYLEVRGTDLFALDEAGVTFSADDGANWTDVINTGLPLPLIYGINLFFVKDTNLFVSYTDGSIYHYRINGTNWTKIRPAALNDEVYSICLKDTDLFVSSYQGNIYRTGNNGVNWDTVITGLYASEIIISGSNLFAATSNGIFLSKDNGSNWNSVNEGLPFGYASNKLVLKLAISNDTLFAGLSGRGVWRRPLSEMINNNSVASTPKGEPTIKSFPNPFTQSTSIKFSTPDHSFVQVSIHNLLGSEVARLFSGELNGGEHSFTWDAHGMSAGMYIAMVKVGGEVREIPIVLVK